MPYHIVKKAGGYILTDIKGHKYSKRPLSLAQVKRQRTAVILSEILRKAKRRMGNGPAFTKLKNDIDAHSAILLDRMPSFSMRESARRTQNANKARKHLGSRKIERRFSRSVKPVGSGKKKKRKRRRGRGDAENDLKAVGRLAWNVGTAIPRLFIPKLKPFKKILGP